MIDPLYIHDDLRKVYSDHLAPRDEDDLWRIHDWLWRIGYGHPGYQMYDGPKDIAILNRLERVLAEIAQIFEDGAMSESASDKLCMGLLGIRAPQDVEWGDDTKYGPLPDMSAADALHFLDDRHRDLKTLIWEIRTEVRTSGKERRTLSTLNIQGVKVVAVARDIWKSEIGKDAPAKDLNPASPFGRFLEDLLQALEIEGNARSVFRAWAREHHAWMQGENVVPSSSEITT